MKHERKKPKKTASTLRLFLCILILWLTGGCAAISSPTFSGPPQPMTHASAAEGYGWWFVRFRMERPPEETRWEKDLLIAHRVAAPLISANDNVIDLWRFHRRSAEDKTGHQFSFLFYSSSADADRINQMVLNDPLVKRMLSDGVVREVVTDAVDHNDHPNVGDTSDPKWSPVMQNTWPYYIMGVSRMWLGMIEQVSHEIGIADDPTLSQLLEHYEQVNNEVTRIWRQEGYHALLHHLNAIFGYEAMVYWEKRWKSF